ncbi:hypothetical protein [Oceanobacillus sp. FSL W7-1293]|uniref:hypothetical protein n=1 Tax=Oceanobacillus TaxID=182709 RepID=UPI0030D5C060
MSKSISSIAIGLILIFVIQMVSLVGMMFGVTFFVEGEEVSSPPISFSMYLIPIAFILFGIINFFIKVKTN